jgi:outer membrane receptor protein involved in Fe transport
MRGGIELTLSSQDKLSLGGRYGGGAMEGSFELDYSEWSEPGDVYNSYTSQEDGNHSRNFYALMFDYLHQFSKKDHSLSLQTFFSRRDGDQLSTTELLDMAGVIINGQRSTEEGPGTRMQLRLDYKLPLRENDRFEAGYQTRVNRSENVYNLYEYDSITGDYTFLPQFSHSTEYSRTIHSLYSLYSGEWGSFGYQGGLRGEYMYRAIELVGEDEDFTIDRWDYFPTAHISYQFLYGQQLMASYTRRIDRPRQWWLEPFITWSDAYNVRMGNPALKPEYIDSYELGHQLSFGKNLFSTEAYYRITHNKVERVRSVYSENIIMHTVENVGTDYARGVELMLDLNLSKWWNINIMTNLYDYRIEGTLYGEDFSEEDFNWSARFNNEFKVLKFTKVQINGRYRSPSISAQGQREGFFTADAALKQEFLDRRLSATLQLRDIFGTGKREYRSEGEDFYYYSYFEHTSPMVMLTFTYNFNNYKPERLPDENGEIFEGMEDFN